MHCIGADKSVTISTMKQFTFIGFFLLMLVVTLAAMPQIQTLPQMPGKHLGQIMSSGFLKQTAGQQGQGQGQGQRGPPPPQGQNGNGQGQNNLN